MTTAYCGSKISGVITTRAALCGAARVHHANKSTDVGLCHLRPSAAPRAGDRPTARHVAHAASPGESAAASPSSNYCVVIECDGVLIDVHNDAHRRAFNTAFERIGYNCVNWNPAIYTDLLRLGDGTGQGLIRSYYEIRGWPTMLATSDRAAFVAKVDKLKDEVLKEMVAASVVPLRDGVAQFVDDLLAAGVKPVVVAATASSPADSVVSAAMMNLGPNRAFRMQVLTLGAEGGGGEGGGEEPGPLSLEQQVSQAQSQAKSQVATSFARAINLQKMGGAGMRVDPNMLAAQERAGLVSSAYMAAIVAAMGCEPSRSALVSASHSLMESGKGAGMFCAGVPPSLAARGGFSAADAAFDGFGAGGGLTWRKLKAMMDAKAP